MDDTELREAFEMRVFQRYFISTITRKEGRVRGTGAFDLWPENCKTKDEFCARGEDGHYVDESLNPAWWGWKEGYAHADTLQHPCGSAVTP